MKHSNKSSGARTLLCLAVFGMVVGGLVGWVISFGVELAIVSGPAKVSPTQIRWLLIGSGMIGTSLGSMLGRYVEIVVATANVAVTIVWTTILTFTGVIPFRRLIDGLLMLSLVGLVAGCVSAVLLRISWSLLNYQHPFRRVPTESRVGNGPDATKVAVVLRFLIVPGVVFFGYGLQGDRPGLMLLGISLAVLGLIFVSIRRG